MNNTNLLEQAMKKMADNMQKSFRDCPFCNFMACEGVYFTSHDHTPQYFEYDGATETSTLSHYEDGKWVVDRTRRERFCPCCHRFLESAVEVWKHIPSMLNVEASNFGRIRTHRKILKPQENNSGYLKTIHTHHAWLPSREVKHAYYIHRLIARAFIPNPYHLPQVNHVDGNVYNNNLNNLEWCSASWNARHKVNEPHKPIKWEAIIATDTNGQVINRFKSIADTARNIGVSASSIRRCLLGSQKTADGYMLKGIRSAD